MNDKLLAAPAHNFTPTNGHLRHHLKCKCMHNHSDVDVLSHPRHTSIAGSSSFWAGCRDDYAVEELLGGRRGKFAVDQRKFRRDDVVLVSAQNPIQTQLVLRYQI